MAEYPDSLWRERNSSPVAFVKFGDCRNFMRQVVEEEWVWPKLKNNWGGHLHRAVLDIALQDNPDNELVDIVPVVLEVMYADESDKLGPDARARSFFYALDEVRSDSESCDKPMLEQVEMAMCYRTQGDLPGGILLAFDGLKRDFLQDKYFYRRDGFTGRRVGEPKFKRQPDFTE